MTNASEAALRLAEIDALQDEVLGQLAELERRSEAVLASCQTLAVKAAAASQQPALPATKTARRKAA